MIRQAFRQSRRERGQILVMAALLVTALVGFLGLVIDGGFFYAQRRHAQSAADAAALAGARLLFEGASATSARATAQEYAAGNGYNNNGASNTVTVNIPPLSGEHVGDPDYVEVLIDENPTTFFIHVLLSAGSVRGRGVAGIHLFPEPYALVVLEDDACNAYNQSGSANMTVTGGGIMVNSDCPSQAMSVSGASTSLQVDGSIDVHGGYQCTPGPCSVSPPPEENVAWTVSDPLATLPPPWPQPISPDSAGTAASPQTLRITTGPNRTLRPGTYYGGIYANCTCTITLQDNGGQPGIYIMAGGGFGKAGGANFVGDNVMIYLTDCNGPTNSAPCSGDGSAQPVTLTGNGILDLSPPTSGLYQGITFWQDEQITADFSMSGDASLTQGIFYAPGARLDITGNAQLGVVQLVVNTFRIAGSTSLSLSYGEFRTFEAPDVTLVE